MLQNSSIMITGGGSGIGAALATRLAANNKVIICGRNETNLKKVAGKSENISYEVVDISDYHSIAQLFATVKEKGIVLNVLINNAGVAEVWELDKGSLRPEEIFEKAATNFSGAVAMIQLFIDQADKSVDNVIINNTSEIAIMPVPVLPLYSASKAALSVFTRSLRVQLKHTKFKVVELLTPAINTDMPKRLNNTGKLADANEFAMKVIEYVNRGGIEYTQGGSATLLGLFRRFMPGTGLSLIDKMSRKQLAVK